MSEILKVRDHDKLCTARTKAGAHCAFYRMKGLTVCFVHNPDAEVQAKNRGEWLAKRTKGRRLDARKYKIDLGGQSFDLRLLSGRQALRACLLRKITSGEMTTALFRDIQSLLAEAVEDQRISAELDELQRERKKRGFLKTFRKKVLEHD